MIQSDVCVSLDPELQQRAALLARIVRGSPRYVDALRWWLGFDLARLPSAPDAEHELSERDALLLDLPPGASVLRREGYLLSALGGTRLRVAEVTALVRTSGLGLDLQQKAALREGTVPLGKLLDAQRATHYAYLVGGPPVDDRPALRSRATLLRAGRPVAITRETVLWKTLTHCDRTPADLPGYVQAPIRIGVAS
jgi:hypothetical protein